MNTNNNNPSCAPLLMTTLTCALSQTVILIVSFTNGNKVASWMLFFALFLTLPSAGRLAWATARGASPNDGEVKGPMICTALMMGVFFLACSDLLLRKFNAIGF